MSFQTFRKYEKHLLMAAVIFTVAVFVFFPAFGDMSTVFGGGGVAGTEIAGEFVVETTGETERVTADEFYRVQRQLARLTGQRSLDDEDVWAQIILRADARGAGLRITDVDVAQAIRGILTQGVPGASVSEQQVEGFWRGLGFASARDFTETVRAALLAGRWQELQMANAAIVDAEAVYEQWKARNELYDARAAVIASVPPEALDDPGDEVLREHFEALNPTVRERLFSTPARKDVVYAWRPLDAALDGLAEEARAALPEVTAAQVEARWRTVKDVRWPAPADDGAPADGEPEADADDEGAADADDAAPDGPTAEQRALLERELHNINVLAEAARELREQAESAAADEVEGPVAPDAEGPAGVGKPAFLAAAERWGMQTADPEGLLDPEALEALDVIGGSRLPTRLATLGAGELHQLRPFEPDAEVAFMVLVEQADEPEPLGFEEARDEVLEHWRGDQRDRDAEAFLDALLQAAREHEQAAEPIAAIMDEVEQRVAQRLESAPEDAPLDEATLRAEEIEAAQSEIDAVALPLRHLVFEDVAAEQGVELRTVEGISRNPQVNSAAAAEIADDDVLRFLRTANAVFQLEVDGVSRRPIYDVTTDNWFVFHVLDARFPDMDAMYADEDGMELARRQAERNALQLYQLELTPGAINARHDLRVAAPEEPRPEPAEQP